MGLNSLAANHETYIEFARNELRNSPDSSAQEFMVYLSTDGAPLLFVLDDNELIDLSLDDVYLTQGPVTVQTVNQSSNQDPTADPTIDPTAEPTSRPTANPTAHPTLGPTDEPTLDPTSDRLSSSTLDPTVFLTTDPAPSPSDAGEILIEDLNTTTFVLTAIVVGAVCCICIVIAMFL